MTNVSAAQVDGTKMMEITYDVFSTETNLLTMSLSVSNGAAAVNAPSVSGDVGANVASGTGKTVVWNGGVDWNGNVADLLYTVTAYDSVICPVEKTGQTNSTYSGDDGDLQSGTEWPNPRFTSITNGSEITVIDNLTGLEWIQAPQSLSSNSSAMAWNGAIDFCNALSFAGYDDWRLPSRKELISLVDYGQYSPALPTGHPFSGTGRRYWSGTSYAYNSFLAWCVFMQVGNVEAYSKTLSSYYVWPVRSRQNIEMACPVERTGQITKARTGDDGDLKPGTAWPNPRFTDNGDGTVIDNLTGLEWIKSPGNFSDNSAFLAMDRNSAIDFCSALSFANHDDWRLPSIKELESLVHCGKGSWGDQPFEWLNSSETPFASVQFYTYWSGTSYANYAFNPWYMSMNDGTINNGDGSENRCVWPVRSR